MTQIGYILIGWILGVVSMLISRWLQTREDRRKREIDIICGVLSYLFKIRQVFNDLLTDRRVLEEVRKQFPDKVSEMERKMYARFDDELSKDFFPSLMFHSFQLRRIEDQGFWQDFENLMNKCGDLSKTAMGAIEFDKILELNEDILRLMKNFTEKCIEKTKV
jgi:hypothetical protein